MYQKLCCPLKNVDFHFTLTPPPKIKLFFIKIYPPRYYTTS